eukprot:TRINITY_DN2369_c0_g1_i24.p4 TRINITY_DN2369_c0_g1~~TRINITY_DN2369_c0_g1_i24.p4  ORF type:complete len:137 (+),score=24.87 TRINITY_DN2369_c0_g1_i24:99-509(+)
MLNKIVFAAAVLCAGAQALPDAKPTSCAAVSCLVGSTCKVHPVHGARCVKNEIVGCDELIWRCGDECEETFEGTCVLKNFEGMQKGEQRVVAEQYVRGPDGKPDKTAQYCPGIMGVCRFKPGSNRCERCGREKREK